jgi:hypothetical protein
VTSSRTPGLYQELESRSLVPMVLGPTGVPAFIGIALRGPTSVPVRISSLEEFNSVYGSLPDGQGYLRDCIRGFFSNGGKVCYVLRVAHLVRRGREDVAHKAQMKFLDGSGKKTLTVQASNEGTWGSAVRVSVTRQEPRVSTLLTLDLKAGDTSAVVKSTLGLRRGTVVQLRDGGKTTCRTILELSGKNITWDTNEPLEEDFKSGSPTFIEPVEFSIEARWGHTKEIYQNLSMSRLSDFYFERIINTKSGLLRVEDHWVDTPGPDNVPVTVVDASLENGEDGLFTVTPADFIGANIGPEERYGIAALEAVEEVDILVCPDVIWALENSSGFRIEKDVHVVQEAMVTQCERMKTRTCILDMPDPVDHKRAGQWRLLFDSAYATFYFPWIVVEGRGGKMKTIPPSGHVAGLYAHCDGAVGPHRAPANEEMSGIFDLARSLSEADMGSLNDQHINCIRVFPQRGIRVWGARTTSNDPQWRYINVRRVINAIISSVEQGLQWSVFETNNHMLWKKLTRQISGFLMALYKEGWFAGGKPEDAFFVKCDHETNPPDVIEAGQIVIECGVAPVRPAEFLVFRVDADVEGIGAEAAEEV